MISDKKKKRKPLQLNERELEDLVEELAGDGLPEGVFGILDNNLDRAADEAKQSKLPKFKKKIGKPLRTIPKLQINKPELPTEAEGLDLGNVVNVPEKLLRTIATGVDRNTAGVNKLLLETLIPLMLSYDTGTSYARAAMRDGLNVEIDFDSGLAEAVKHIGYLNVLFFYIKRSKLPRSVKERFMFKFSDDLAAQAMHTLVETNKIHDRQKISQELQAVVYSGQQRKTTVHNVGEKQQQGQPAAQTQGRTPVAAVKRRSK